LDQKKESKQRTDQGMLQSCQGFERRQTHDKFESEIALAVPRTIESTSSGEALAGKRREPLFDLLLTFPFLH